MSMLLQNEPFRGNPAAVCLLNSWLDDASLLKVAAENNLSATAFLVRGDGATNSVGSRPVAEIRLAATRPWRPLMLCSKF